MDHETVKVRPNQLRFSQDSIADHFKLGNGKEFLLRDALNDLRTNRLKASDFTLIEVAQDENGVQWSNDNRRLWLFRKAPVSIIEVNLYSRPLFRAPPEPHLREEMGRQEYFPRVRKRPVNAQRNPSVKIEKEGKKAAPYPSASVKEHRAQPVFSGREERKSEEVRRASPVFSGQEKRSEQERGAPPVSSSQEERRSEQERGAPPVSSSQEERRSEQEKGAPPVSSSQEERRSEQEKGAPPVSPSPEERRSEEERRGPPETPGSGKILIYLAAAATVLIWGVRKLSGV